MAKKKTTDQVAGPEEANAANQNLEGSEELTPTDTTVEQVETPEETPAQEPEKKEIKKSSQKEKIDTGIAAQQKEIPIDVLKVLQCFPTEEELYVNKHGGVFSKGTEHSAVAGAILYKNPYYNSL